MDKDGPTEQGRKSLKKGWKMEERHQYRNHLAERVKLARENAGFTQEQMARLLRISQPTYSKYEGGRGDDPASTLPHHLIPDFCLVCRVTADWLLSGQGGEALSPHPMNRPRKKSAT